VVSSTIRKSEFDLSAPGMSALLSVTHPTVMSESAWLTALQSALESRSMKTIAMDLTCKTVQCFSSVGNLLAPDKLNPPLLTIQFGKKEQAQEVHLTKQVNLPARLWANSSAM